MENTRRTYVYYSDAKILELRQQMPLSRWERATRRVTEVGGTVLGTGGKIGIGPPASEPILLTMQAVWIDLFDEGLIGSFDEPEQFFYGRLVFYYGIFDEVDPSVFFLVGATDRTIVGLGGSKKHVRGFRGREIPVADDAQAVVMEPDVATLIYTASETPSQGSTESLTAEPGEDIRANHVAGLYKNWQFWRGRKMEFEILARRELLSPVSPPYVESPKNVLIGSPIFVAQA